MPIVQIRQAIPATPRAHILRLDLQGQPWPYRAGQAAYLTPEGAPKRRPYSMASAPEETARHGMIEFLVQTGLDGLSGLTPDLIRPGTPVLIEGPIGSFVFPEHPRERRFVFIAGGTGIAPLRSMLWHSLLAERDGHAGLIYSVRSPEELAYLDEFKQLEREKRIDFRYTVTRTTAEGWTGRQGRIDVAFLQDFIMPGETLCFICGPPALVGELAPQLKQLGVKDEQIRLEQWA
jgi:ferredoxin-NADP reductase